MMKVGLNWNVLTTNLVAQFCFLLLRRVEHIDPGTSGLHIWRIDRTGAHWLDGDDIWGGQRENYRLTSFLRTAMSEIPKEKLQRLIEQYKLLDVFRKLMPLEM